MRDIVQLRSIRRNNFNEVLKGLEAALKVNQDVARILGRRYQMIRMKTSLLILKTMARWMLKVEMREG